MTDPGFFMDIKKIKRILIVRTDRIGDVVLSTPTITAARKAFPDAYIAMMVSPGTREIVAGNPFLNEVVVFDKGLRHKGLSKTFGFAGWLRRRRFDLALILHSTARVNLICFLAGIPERVGYARGKLDFLLTKRMAYTKRLGEKHEAEYSLDLLRVLGVKAEMSPPVMVLREEDKEDADRLLRGEGWRDGRGFIVMHPGASCISKMWPLENFAKVGDILSRRFNLSVVLVSGPEQAALGNNVRALMNADALSLCGKTSLGGLAALLGRARLFISNDSGPVHIACAVGTPVISIFGRNEKGLSPLRWGPLGEKSRVIHKDVGCVECLAHNCKRGFLCLKSVTVEEVVEAAIKFLS